MNQAEFYYRDKMIGLFFKARRVFIYRREYIFRASRGNSCIGCKLKSIWYVFVHVILTIVNIVIQNIPQII